MKKFPEVRYNYPFAHELAFELRQATEEGVDISAYADLIRAVDALPLSDEKIRLAEAVYDLIQSAPPIPDYPYVEPTALEEIRAVSPGFQQPAVAYDAAGIQSRLRGAWYGRIAGCLLGKVVEGMKSDELTPMLRETNNFPLRRYMVSGDMTEELCSRYKYNLRGKCYADVIPNAPADDDTNYTVMAQQMIARCGRAFTPDDVAETWLRSQPLEAYFTAERVAFGNLASGIRPPDSARYQNHYREWIGAQIRADYYGYINPGDPAAAADMAWRDASISHVKNGVYGAMFVAAMIARAAVSRDIEDIILTALTFIPARSRLHARINDALRFYKSGESQAAFHEMIHADYDDHYGHDWCHTISNAMIVVGSLLYGGGDYGKSICLAVQTGFDTDCNGATVGSILGMMLGIEGVDPVWTAPLNGRLDTQLVDVGTVEIEKLVAKTLEQLA